MAHRLAACSWSLLPKDPLNLADSVRRCGLTRVQLALEPLRTGAWDDVETLGALREAGVEVISGMMAFPGEDYATLERIRETGGVRPDGSWGENLRIARETADLAGRLAIPLVTFHAGFVPEDPRDPARTTIVGRLRKIAAAFDAAGVRLALETGQEDAQTMTGVLKDLGDFGVGVNFDPANMILYGSGDPVEAFDRLSGWVRQVHVKDATPPAATGKWGTETPTGEGAVDWARFLELVRARTPEADLVIERESGTRRVEDVMAAAELVTRLTEVKR